MYTLVTGGSFLHQSVEDRKSLSTVMYQKTMFIFKNNHLVQCVLNNLFIKKLLATYKDISDSANVLSHKIL